MVCYAQEQQINSSFTFFSHPSFPLLMFSILFDDQGGDNSDVNDSDDNNQDTGDGRAQNKILLVIGPNRIFYIFFSIYCTYMYNKR